MSYFANFFKKVTQSQAFEEAGPFETAFFQYIYRLTFVVGISTSDTGVGYTLYRGLVLVMTMLLVTMEIWRPIGDNLDIDEIISSINIIIIHLLTFWKLMSMASNKDVYKRLAKTMDSSDIDISTNRRKQLVQFWVDTHWNYLRLLLVLSNFTLLMWHTFPLIDSVEYNLMIDVHVPLDYRSPLLYAVTYFVIFIMFNSMSYLVIMSEVIMQAHLLSLSCQYAVLGDCFESVLDDCAADFPDVDHPQLTENKLFIEKYILRLGHLVKQHKLLLNHTTDLQNILSGPMLGQLAVSGLLICCVGYQATVTIADSLVKFLMSLGYLSCHMFTLYLVCRWCEEITSQSYLVGEKAYFSGWENGMSKVPGVKATIMLVIVRANKPLVFVAGGMYPLSLTSYTNIVKASYSALSILLQTKESGAHSK